MTVFLSDETSATPWSQSPILFWCRNKLSCVVIFTLSKGTRKFHLFLYSGNREVDREFYGRSRPILICAFTPCHTWLDDGLIFFYVGVSMHRDRVMVRNFQKKSEATIQPSWEVWFCCIAFRAFFQWVVLRGQDSIARSGSQSQCRIGSSWPLTELGI